MKQRPASSGARERLPLVFAIAMLAGLVLHLFYFWRGFYSISWDESGRILDAYHWAIHGSIQTGAWLPFYRILVGSALKVVPDLIITPRVISAVFGLAVIPAVGWLAHELFRDRRTTGIALVCAALLPQRIVLGLAPLSSIMFGAVVVAAMAALARSLLREESRSLWLCATLLAVATTIRYEGWVFAGVFCGIVLVRWSKLVLQSKGFPRSTLLSLAGLGLVVLAFPMVWIATGFYSPVGNVVAGAARFSNAEILMRNPLCQFVWTNALSLNLIGGGALAGGLLRGPLRMRLFLAAAFGPLLAVSLVLLAVRSAQTGPAWRMTAVWSFQLVPFTASMLAGLWRMQAPVLRPRAALSTLFVFFIGSTFLLEYQSAWAFTESERAAGAFLGRIVENDSSASILIEAGDFYYLNIQVASQHPDRFVLNTVPGTSDPPILRVGGDAQRAFEDANVALLMFKSREYKEFLGQSPNVTKVGEFGDWAVYRQKAVE